VGKGIACPLEKAQVAPASAVFDSALTRLQINEKVTERLASSFANRRR
jgi:hypothetical protein